MLDEIRENLEEKFGLELRRFNEIDTKADFSPEGEREWQDQHRAMLEAKRRLQDFLNSDEC